MAYTFSPRSTQETTHKVFVSYYHKDDQSYRNRFEKDFGHLCVTKSVQPGEIDTDLSIEYIKRLIREGYITDSSVILVLVGPKTYCRKHVDWEISAGLSKKAGGVSGLLGILLSHFPLSGDRKYSPKDLPPRLADNVESGYANLYHWSWVTTQESRIKDAIQDAFDRRLSKTSLIDNSRLQYSRNLCE